MKTLDLDKARERLLYHPETGAFTWRNGHRAGSYAGMSDGEGGYIRIRVSGINALAHRLAWAFANGQWPSAEIDHINGQRSDNRLSNLREATRNLNGRNLSLKSNNTSGVAGVSRDRRGKWEAFVHFERRKIVLGRLVDFEKAVRARRAGERRYFGEFARVG